MHDERERLQIAACLTQRVQHAKGLIVERAGHLGQTHPAACRIKLDKVGKGAAHIHAHNGA